MYVFFFLFYLYIQLFSYILVSKIVFIDNFFENSEDLNLNQESSSPHNILLIDLN